jgi:hypothetical protein
MDDAHQKFECMRALSNNKVRAFRNLFLKTLAIQRKRL